MERKELERERASEITPIECLLAWMIFEMIWKGVDETSRSLQMFPDF